MPPIDSERTLDPRPGFAVGVSGVSIQGCKLAAAPVDRDHVREFEGAELCVERVNGVAVAIPWHRFGNELGGDLLLIVGSVPVQSTVGIHIPYLRVHQRDRAPTEH